MDCSRWGAPVLRLFFTTLPARLAVRKKSERKRAYRGGKAAPSEAGRESVQIFINLIKDPKKAENHLDFHVAGCKLLFEIAFLLNRNPVSSSFQPYFNQKYTKTDQVCNNSFDPEHEIPAGAMCLRFCWAFLCRLGIGFLVGPSCTRMGKRPAFLYSTVNHLNLTFAI